MSSFLPPADDNSQATGAFRTPQPERTKSEAPAKWDASDAMAGAPQFAFLFDIDQVCYMLGCSREQLMTKTFRMGIDDGDPDSTRLKVIDIATTGPPELKVDYREFKRWCRRMSIPIYALP